MNNTWHFYNPKFEYRLMLEDFDSPWVGHSNFAYDLIANFKPSTIVELGTFKGTSLFSFAQAVKDFDLNTTVYAIDSWKGDEHSGFYGEEIYQSVVEITRKFYAKQRIRLVRKYFDEAVDDFENESIDILHIDGLHTYDAVKNDFSKWFPKVKPTGIIIFHDILVADFGVWKLWEEIKNNYKDRYNFIEFVHNYGLGVMFPKQDNLLTNIESSTFVKIYEIKHDIEYIKQSEKNNTEELELIINQLKSQIQEQYEYIKYLEHIKNKFFDLPKNIFFKILNKLKLIR